MICPTSIAAALNLCIGCIISDAVATDAGIPIIAAFIIASGISFLSFAFLIPELKSNAIERITLLLASIARANFSSLFMPSLILSTSIKNAAPPLASERPSSENFSSNASIAARPLASSGSENRIFNPITFAPACEILLMTSAIRVLGQGHLPSFATDSSSMATIAISAEGLADAKSAIRRS